jgi:hypothetical protein
MVVERNLKYVQKYVKNDVWQRNDNVKRQNTQFFQIFHLAAMSQCEGGSEGHIWDSAYAD